MKKVIQGPQAVLTRVRTGNTNVTTTAAAISSDGSKLGQGVQLKADAANSVAIWVGSSAGVTAGTDSETDGFPLDPGEGVFYPTQYENEIYAIVSAGSETLHRMAF